VSVRSNLKKYGLLNYDSTDMSGMVGENKDVIGTFCLSRTCVGAQHVSRYGILVSIVKEKKCPKCKQSDFLSYSSISKFRADKFKEYGR